MTWYQDLIDTWQNEVAQRNDYLKEEAQRAQDWVHGRGNVDPKSIRNALAVIAEAIPRERPEMPDHLLRTCLDLCAGKMIAHWLAEVEDDDAQVLPHLEWGLALGASGAITQAVWNHWRWKNMRGPMVLSGFRTWLEHRPLEELFDGLKNDLEEDATIAFIYGLMDKDAEKAEALISTALQDPQNNFVLKWSFGSPIACRQSFP